MFFCTRPCPHEFASSSVANTKCVSFLKRKSGPFSSQVSEAHYCRLLATLPQLFWPAYYSLLTIIRVCMENITCAKNVLNWCKIKLSFELTYGFRSVVRFPVFLQRFRP